MSAKLTISHATVNQTGALVELIQSAYRGEESLQGWTSEANLIDGPRITFDEMEATLMSPDDYVLVAHNYDDRLIGCAAVTRETEGVCSFGKFAVSPLFQGVGAGKQLLDAAEAIATSHFGAAKMVLTVIDGRSELEAFYERRGYVRTNNSVKMKDIFQGDIISRGLDLVLNEFMKPL
jgi:N-acetylglutamate synthase-like GNAT family acetyltransferase